MDTVDEFLGKDCGESNFCLRDTLACLIIFGPLVNDVLCADLYCCCGFLFSGHASKESPSRFVDHR